MIVTLKVTFLNSSKRYSYLYDAPPEQVIEPGDIAVVDSPYGGRQVVDIRDIDWEGNTYGVGAKKVLGVISTAEQRREEERKARAKDLERKLERKLNSTTAKRLMLKILAREDKEVAAWLEELEELQ